MRSRGGELCIITASSLGCEMRSKGGELCIITAPARLGCLAPLHAFMPWDPVGKGDDTIESSWYTKRLLQKAHA